MEGVVVASALVGCMVGALVAGALSDRFGRKAVLIVSAVLFVVSAIGTAVPPTVTLLICARWIGGVGVGMASMLAPMYLSEVSPPHLRGRLIALYQLAITIGILVAYFSNVFLQWLSTNVLAEMSAGPWRWILVDEVWRGMFGAGAIPAIVFLLLLLIVPETPRWLAKQGRIDEAARVLTRVVGPKEADRELAEIRQALDQEGGSLAPVVAAGTAHRVGDRHSAPVLLASEWHQRDRLLRYDDLQEGGLGTECVTGRAGVRRLRQRDLHVRGGRGRRSVRSQALAVYRHHRTGGRPGDSRGSVRSRV